MNKCQEALERALNTIANLPASYLDLKIMDNILKQTDWDAANTAICQELAKVDCTIGEQELDRFWKENKLFKNLLGYIEDNCNCA